jgi:disulfide bond formation protein DsbB
MSYRVIASTGDRVGVGFEDAGRTIAILSALALAGALGLEYIGHILPCPLCLDQRIAYYAAVPLGLLAFLLAPTRRSWALLLLAILAAAFLINAGLGVYHAGVEWKWWAGPTACSGIGTVASNPRDLLKSLEASDVIRCDEAALRIFGLSLAGYSAILSVALAAIAATGFARGLRGH